MEGIDYSSARPNLDSLWSAGKQFVCRYLANLPNDKVLSSRERAALHTRGFQIVLNWEQARGDAAKGYAMGQRHAREALRQATALGAPASLPIYFSVDVDVRTSSQMKAVASYLDGAATVLGRQRVGVYGEFAVIEAMIPNHAAWGWQTYAWSSGRTSSKAHIKQYRNDVNLAGGTVDLDVSLKDPIGAWLPTGGSDVYGDADMNAEQDRRLYNLDRLNSAILAGADDVTKVLCDDGQYRDFPGVLAAFKREAAMNVDAATASPAAAGSPRATALHP